MLDEGLLDDTERLLAADRSGALRALAGAGAQVRQSAFLAGEAGVDRLPEADRPRAVVVLGAGHAALAGDLVAALGGPRGHAPVLVLRDPGVLPLWVGVADLVLAVSHVGTEIGLLSALDDAAGRGASVLGVGPADTPLQDACARARAVFLPVPVGWPPYAALWSLATPLLLAAHTMGLFPLDRRELDLTADLLDTVAERCRPASGPFVNPAKVVALELAEALPVLWAGSGLGAVAARRFAIQLAGRAAVPAVWGLLPGALVESGGLLDTTPGPDADQTADLFRDRVAEPAVTRPRLVLLGDPVEPRPGPDHLGRARRFAEERGVGVTELRPEGSGPVRRFASLVALGDFASVYLGLAGGRDPAGVRADENEPGI